MVVFFMRDTERFTDWDKQNFTKFADNFSVLSSSQFLILPQKLPQK